MKVSAFDMMYEPYEDELAVFGSQWVGPRQYEHMEWQLIAQYKKRNGCDGFNVNVYCMAAPARFYKIQALDSLDSMNQLQKGFALSTGSSAWELAATLAESIRDGALGLED